MKRNTWRPVTCISFGKFHGPRNENDASRYEKTSAPGAPVLPQMKNFRLGLNVAECDARPLVVCLATGDEAMKGLHTPEGGATNSRRTTRLITAAFSQKKRLSLGSTFCFFGSRSDLSYLRRRRVETRPINPRPNNPIVVGSGTAAALRKFRLS